MVALPSASSDAVETGTSHMDQYVVGYSSGPSSFPCLTSRYDVEDEVAEMHYLSALNVELRKCPLDSLSTCVICDENYAPFYHAIRTGMSPHINNKSDSPVPEIPPLTAETVNGEEINESKSKELWGTMLVASSCCGAKLHYGCLMKYIISSKSDVGRANDSEGEDNLSREQLSVEDPPGEANNDEHASWSDAHGTNNSVPQLSMEDEERTTTWRHNHILNDTTADMDAGSFVMKDDNTNDASDSRTLTNTASLTAMKRVMIKCFHCHAIHPHHDEKVSNDPNSLVITVTCYTRLRSGSKDTALDNPADNPTEKPLGHYASSILVEGKPLTPAGIQYIESILNTYRTPLESKGASPLNETSRPSPLQLISRSIKSSFSRLSGRDVSSPFKNSIVPV